MTTPAKSGRTDMLPTVEETRRISDAERDALRASLREAREDIAAGRYDVVTPGTLQAEFAGIFDDELTDEELDARLVTRPSQRR